MYAVTAWLVLQVNVVVAEPLGFPEWTTTALIYAAIVGFPVTFILTWVIDIRPEGLIFDVPLLGSNTPDQREQRRSDFVLAGVTLLLTAIASYYLVSLLLAETVTLETSGTASETSTEIEKNTIAVLAFANIDRTEDTDFFAAGLAEEILNSLARLPELQVASRTSSFQFKGQKIDARDVAKHLRVNHLLEGSARQHNQLIHISARLLNLKGFTVWGEGYRKPIEDIFAIQQEIAENVVKQLKVALSLESKNSLTEHATESSDAYVVYLEGLGRLRASLDADAMVKASTLFEQSIARDSEFANAYAGLCEAKLRLYDIGRDSSDFESAESACNRANELSIGTNSRVNSEVHVALGKLYLARGWHEKSEAQLEQVIAIEASHLEALIQLGQLYAEQGKTAEAAAVLQKAIDANPDDWSAHEARANFFYRNGDYAQASEAYDKVVALAPGVATAHGGRGAAYWMSGDYDTALSAYKASVAIKPSRQAYTNIGSLYYNQGEFAQAVDYQKKALDLAPNDHRTIGRLAEAYYFNRQKEDALVAFQRAATQAQSDLLINSKDWKSRSLLGLYLAMLSKKTEALAAAEAAIRQSEDNAEAWYFLAVVRQQLQDSSGAMEALRAAVEKKNSFFALAESDPFLASLKQDSEFNALKESLSD